MTTITLSGELGPIDALSLQDRLARELTSRRPQIVVDLRRASSVHPAIVAALVGARRQARRRSGTVEVVSPDSAGGRRTFELTTLAGR